MKIKIKLSVIFLLIFCLFTISSADVGIGISEVGTISSITGIKYENTTPVGYRLKQNFPNPFNPSTTIEFTLPTPAPVKLEVFNTLGQIVETLLDKRMNAGSHEVTFDAPTLPSGIYLYRIQAGKFSEVRKMVLLR